MAEIIKNIEDEKHLINRILDGDGEAFGLIYDKYKNAIYTTIIYPRLLNREAAEEILQETFLFAANKIKYFTWQNKSIFYWLRAIAINKTREYVNKEKKETTGNISKLIREEKTKTQNIVPEINLLQKLHQEELKKRIETVLSFINLRYKEVLELRLKHEYSRQNCADILGVTIETFDVIFFRACKAFKQEFLLQFGQETETLFLED